MDIGRNTLNERNIIRKIYKYNNDIFNNNYFIKEKKETSKDGKVPFRRSIKIKKSNLNPKHSIDFSLFDKGKTARLTNLLFNNYNSFINHDKDDELNNDLDIHNNPKKINVNNYLNIINHKHSRDNMESVEWMYFNNISKNLLLNKNIIRPNIYIPENDSFKDNNSIKKKFKYSSILINNNKKLTKSVKNQSTLNRNRIIINVRDKKNIEKISSFEENKFIINNANKKRKLVRYHFLSESGVHNRQKKINQDCYLILPKINECNNISIFGVLNSHGPYGAQLSKEICEFFSDYFTQNNTFNSKENSNSSKIEYNNKLNIITSKKNFITPLSLSQKNFCKISRLKLINNGDKKIKDTYEMFIKNNFSKIFDLFREISDKLHQKYNENKKCDDSGSSLNLLILFNSKNINKIISVNLGNTKSILITDEKKIKELNICHTPCIKEERLRIENNGGVIDRIDWLKVGPLRVWFKGKKYPGLTITRSLGDFEAIPLGIIPIPDIKEYNIDEEKIKILVTATNGVWEFLTNDKIMDITWQFYESKDAKGATEKIVETADKIWKIKNPHNIPDLTTSVFFFK